MTRRKMFELELKKLLKLHEMCAMSKVNFTFTEDHPNLSKKVLESYLDAIVQDFVSKYAPEETQEPIPFHEKDPETFYNNH